jgi:hypothetical protein
LSSAAALGGIDERPRRSYLASIRGRAAGASATGQRVRGAILLLAADVAQFRLRTSSPLFRRRAHARAVGARSSRRGGDPSRRRTGRRARSPASTSHHPALAIYRACRRGRCRRSPRSDARYPILAIVSCCSRGAGFFWMDRPLNSRISSSPSLRRRCFSRRAWRPAVRCSVGSRRSSIARQLEIGVVR